METVGNMVLLLVTGKRLRPQFHAGSYMLLVGIVYTHGISNDDEA